MQNSLQFWLIGTEWFLNLVCAELWMDLVDSYRMVDGMWLIGTELWMDLVDMFRMVDGMWLIGTEL